MPTPAELLYAAVLRPILFRLDPETAHRMTLRLLATMPSVMRPRDSPKLALHKLGLDFPNPVGLAAGADKDILAVSGWNAIGLGFAELGTITPRPQPGEPIPRMWRLIAHRAVINRLGFPSAGMDTAAARLTAISRRRPRMRIGVNLGPNKDTPGERVAADYAALFERLGALADFVVINLSSPNTPGLRGWQAPDRIAEIVRALGTVTLARRPPLLLKLAPDLEPARLSEICRAALELGIDGIVATNTTLAREEVGVASPHPGGLSGAPLRDRARAVIRAIYRETEGHLPIIGVGGIFSAADAIGHIRAGASLVEIYTGLVYQGPGLVGAVKAGLCRLLREEGWGSISDAIGRDA